jgi:hypothetical protein
MVVVDDSGAPPLGEVLVFGELLVAVVVVMRLVVVVV